MTKYRKHLTIEKHLRNMSEEDPAIQKLYSSWDLLKRNIEKQLKLTNIPYITFSRHDSSHSNSIIESIEHFLGEEAIESLGPTDSFMILFVSYAHDIGMALDPANLSLIFSSENFQKFVRNNEDRDSQEGNYKLLASLIQEKPYEEVRLNANDPEAVLGELYFSLFVALQEFLRRNHHRGVKQIENFIKGMELLDLKSRIANLAKLICVAHNEDQDNLLTLPKAENGLAGDFTHPRLIASLLRLGDLFDLDNGRFDPWIEKAADDDLPGFPRMSRLNVLKHRGVTSLLITPRFVRIHADLKGDNYYELLDTSNLFYDWFDYIQGEIDFLKMNWIELTEGLLGHGPGVLDLKIKLNGKEMNLDNRKQSAEYSSRLLDKWAEGNDLYAERWAPFRELLQNAVDSSLIRLWQEYTNYLKKHNKTAKGEEIVPMFLKEDWNEKKHSFFFNEMDPTFFKNCPIEINILLDESKNTVFVVFHDNGVGVHSDEVRFVTTIGMNKHENPRLKKVIDSMPDILLPAGHFGIGIQSVFSLTDRIEYFSFHRASPNIHIIMEKRGNDSSRFVQSLELDQKFADENFGNKQFGTYAVLRINYEKMFSKPGHYVYFSEDLADVSPGIAALKEIKSMLRELKNMQCIDYFKVDLYEYSLPKPKKENDKGHKISDKEVDVAKNSYLKWELHQNENIRSTIANKEKNLPIKENWTDIKWDVINHQTLRKFSFTYPCLKLWDSNNYTYYLFNAREITLVDDSIHFSSNVPSSLEVYYRFSNIRDIQEASGSSYQKKANASSLLSSKLFLFDPLTTKYIGMDRDRLKAGSDENLHIFDSQIKVLNEWWKFETSRSSESFWSELKKYTSDNKLDLEDYALRLLITMIFLFLQIQEVENVKTYLDKLLNANIIAKKIYSASSKSRPNSICKAENLISRFRNITIRDLKFNSNMAPSLMQIMNSNFEYPVELLGKKIGLYPFMYSQIMESNAIPKTTKIEGYGFDDNYTNLPSRLLRIKKIGHTVSPRNLFTLGEKPFPISANLAYVFSIHPFENIPDSIEMDRFAEFYEVFQLTMPYFSKDLNPLMNAGFKPNSRFKNIIVLKKPFRTKLLSNWMPIYDDSIQGLIISPFTKDAIDLLKETHEQLKTAEEFSNAIKSSMNRSEAFQSGQIFDDSEEFKNNVTSTIRKLQNNLKMLYVGKKSPAASHLNNCIQFVKKDLLNRITLENGEDTYELDEKIKKTYLDFIQTFCKNFVLSVLLQRYSFSCCQTEEGISSQSCSEKEESEEP